MTNADVPRGTSAFVRKSNHRQVQSVILRALDGAIVSSISMAHHTSPGVVTEYPRDPLRGLWRTIANNYNAGVLTEAEAHASTVVERNPSRPARGIQERIQKRPVGNGIAAITHPFRLAVRAGD